jgi:hypothetical protein
MHKLSAKILRDMQKHRAQRQHIQMHEMDLCADQPSCRGKQRKWNQKVARGNILDQVTVLKV